MERRDFVCLGLGAVAGISTTIGLYHLKNPSNGNKVSLADRFKPRFRVNIFSEEYKVEEKKPEAVDSIDVTFNEPGSFNANFYLGDSELRRNIRPSDEYVKLCGRLEGSAIFQVQLKSNKSEENFDFETSFLGVSELQYFLIEEFKKENDQGIGPKVRFFEYQGKFPRRAIITPNHCKNPIEYDIHGIEAVTGINKANLLRYLGDPNSYPDFESYKHRVLNGKV